LIFSKTYDIERFWCPPDGILHTDKWGYLQDPHAENLWMGLPDSVSFDYMHDVPVLILLGEPGIGKSQWFKQTKNSLAKSIDERGHRSLWINLGLFDSVGDVIEGLFQSPEFERWLNGGHRLHAFLDGFDECHSQVKVLPKRLLSELQNCPVERLCLRILCRTSEWPPSLEEGLKRLWDQRLQPSSVTPGKETSAASSPGEFPSPWVQSYEMAPLRRQDVTEFLKGESVEPEPFLKEVESKDFVPFASRPQTLAFLVKIYKTRGQFPSSQVELYREGCRELCRESNQERVDARLSGSYTPEELFVVAARIAAISVFGNKHFILRQDVCASDVKSSDISFQDICHGFEKVGGQDVPVRESTVRETLNTGLFTGRAGGRMGWAHQTYAEFLAAEYLRLNGLPVGQLMTLIQHPHSPEGKIPPQLSETAAWLSLMDDDVLERLMLADPETLLLKRRHADPKMQKEAFTERLVGSLLRLLEQGTLLDHRISRMAHLGDLRHPRLGDQLRDRMADRTKNFVVRRVAIRIAEENEVGEVQDAICKVALDQTDDYSVRQPAAQAVLRVGDVHTKARLKEFAIAKRDDDPDDELKAYALLALWPDFLTAEELFENLTEPKNPSFYGHYKIFLSGVLVDCLEVSDLPTALKWVQRHSRCQWQWNGFKEIADAIMRMAYDYLEYPAVLEQFARAALHRLREVEEIIPSDPRGREDNIIFADDAKRLRLFEKMLILTAESNGDPQFGAQLLSHLVIKGDVPRLIDCYRKERRRDVKDIVGCLIALFFDPTDLEQFEALYRLSEANATLAEALRPRLGPVQLDSEYAKILRRRFLREEEPNQAERENGRSAYCSPDIILKLLASIEEGNTAQFASLAWQMIDPETRSGSLGLMTDLSKLRCWDSCEPEIRQRIILAALKYLENCDPEESQWIGTNRINWTAWAGYIAFSLILNMNPDSLTVLPNGVWSKWASAIVACAGYKSSEESKELIATAYGRIPDVMISMVGRQIDYENSSSGHAFIMDRLALCWDEKLTQAMLDKLNDSALSLDGLDSLLTEISRRDVKSAFKFVEMALAVPLAARGQRRNMALVAARVMMLNFPEMSWNMVWPAIAGARLFGRKLLSILARDAYSKLDEAFKGVSEDRLATLYIWISREFPEPEKEKPRRVLRAAGVRDICERILRQLQDRGTTESVSALERLCRELPNEAGDIRWVLDAAKDHMLEVTWTPWTPEEILGVVQDRRKRLVQSGIQLLDVVIESLDRFQQLLQGELPSIRDLWDRQLQRLGHSGKDGISWIPVDERALSDRVARHLREDLTERGIVIGREVEIRPGEETDIHVDAVISHPVSERLDILKVIIEAKGCWNDGLEKDMADQLFGRYMAKNECSHGVYLVGWFHCNSWDPKDYRSKRPRKEIVEMSVQQAKELFDRQSAQLSSELGKLIRAFVLDARLP
jgi:hypothetical protein